jgi:hypothetical protein
MSLLLRPWLLVLALIRAAWLRMRGRLVDLPESVEAVSGRFRLAVWLILATLPVVAQAVPPPARPPEKPQPEPIVMCYDMMPPKPLELEVPFSRIHLLWLALDPAQAPALAAALKAAVASGDIEARVSNLLIRIHAVLSDHHHAARVERVMCYRVSEAGARGMAHKEVALAQVEALVKARKAGQVDPAVLDRAEASLAESFVNLGLTPPPSLTEAREAAKVVVGRGAKP